MVRINSIRYTLDWTFDALRARSTCLRNHFICSSSWSKLSKDTVFKDRQDLSSRRTSALVLSRVTSEWVSEWRSVGEQTSVPVSYFPAVAGSRSCAGSVPCAPQSVVSALAPLHLLWPWIPSPQVTYTSFNILF